MAMSAVDLDAPRFQALVRISRIAGENLEEDEKNLSDLIRRVMSEVLVPTKFWAQIVDLVCQA
jgi:hypothetical protein